MLDTPGIEPGTTPIHPQWVLREYYTIKPCAQLQCQDFLKAIYFKFLMVATCGTPYESIVQRWKAIHDSSWWTIPPTQPVSRLKAPRLWTPHVEILLWRDSAAQWTPPAASYTTPAFPRFRLRRRWLSPPSLVLTTWMLRCRPRAFAGGCLWLGSCPFETEL